MIRITVELVSAVNPSRDRLLGVAYISNDGESLFDKPSYTVKLSKWAPKEKETWKTGKLGILQDEMSDVLTGKVLSFDSVKRGPWDLLFLALKSVIGYRNG